MINTLATLLVFQTIGEGLAYALSLPIPGPVIGMLLLFLYLVMNSDAVHDLAPTSLELLKHLSLLFVPAGVGIMVHAKLIAAEWLPITVAMLASTAVSIGVTATVVRLLQKPALAAAPDLTAVDSGDGGTDDDASGGAERSADRGAGQGAGQGTGQSAGQGTDHGRPQ